MTIQISGQRAAHRAVEAALPRPPLAQLPGRRIPGNNHRAVLAALDARTPEQITGRIGRRWVGRGFEPAFSDGLIRNPIGAAMALLGRQQAGQHRSEAYREFCQENFSRFLDHQPGFLDREEHGGGNVLRARTVDAIILAVRDRHGFLARAGSRELLAMPRQLLGQPEPSPEPFGSGGRPVLR
ncbi:MAG: hypothetical protein ACJ736_29735 [Streptomyces sp.]